MVPLERYLRIFDYDHHKLVKLYAYSICKFAMYDATFLNYRPSQIAACAVIMSINIQHRDDEKQA